MALGLEIKPGSGRTNLVISIATLRSKVAEKIKGKCNNFAIYSFGKSYFFLIYLMLTIKIFPSCYAF